MAGRRNMRNFTPQQRQSLVKRAAKLQARGLSIKDACAKIGIADSQYYTWKNNKGRKTAVRGRRYAKRSNPVNVIADGLNIPASIVVGEHTVARGNLRFTFDEDSE